VEHLADAEGGIRSRVFPGWWLAIAPLLAGDMQQVLTILQAGWRSPEYQALAISEIDDSIQISPPITRSIVILESD
jgi:hypothetical protein